MSMDSPTDFQSLYRPRKAMEPRPLHRNQWLIERVGVLSNCIHATIGRANPDELSSAELWSWIHEMQEHLRSISDFSLNARPTPFTGPGR